ARPGATLGESVRRVRATRGLSLRALSDRTGLSPSLLSQVERGLSDPSLSSLRRVAQALNVSVADLLGEQQQERASKVIRRTARTRLLSPGVGALHELLSGDVERIDARIVTIDPGVAGTEHAPHGGTEFVLVLEGSLEVMMGDTVEVLHLGDAATIEASMTHRVAASQDVPARYLWITVPQK
ncbi:MAG: XRE family transcriptional regulator, partial [Actinomycetota bacterium]